MGYQVIVTDVVARPTAVVPATTTWQEFPALWRELMDEVWACLHAGGITRGCRNIMLYWDDVPHVEVGVELLVPCPLTGRVVASALPAGQVAMTVHRGPCSTGAPRRASGRPARAGRSMGPTTTILPGCGPRSITCCNNGFFSEPCATSQ